MPKLARLLPDFVEALHSDTTQVRCLLCWNNRCDGAASAFVHELAMPVRDNRVRGLRPLVTRAPELASSFLNACFNMLCQSLDNTKEWFKKTLLQKHLRSEQHKHRANLHEQRHQETERINMQVLESQEKEDNYVILQSQADAELEGKMMIARSRTSADETALWKEYDVHGADFDVGQLTSDEDVNRNRFEEEADIFGLWNPTATAHELGFGLQENEACELENSEEDAILAELLASANPSNDNLSEEQPGSSTNDRKKEWYPYESKLVLNTMTSEDLWTWYNTRYEVRMDPIIEVWHGKKWNSEMDLNALSPMWDAGQGRHFYVQELARLSSREYVIPVWWFTKCGVVHADAFKIEITESCSLIYLIYVQKDWFLTYGMSMLPQRDILKACPIQFETWRRVIQYIPA
ncbi:predicted protein [Postia placenta Mad-698-R]|uniref:Uncharacterized protein n=1 Tax=Postia placenta MAD-698-R-SB12 TaxID=670580 RepID=A0A1X6N1U4_9APHY|nr:hypothetical protein POSPLADRAFT_1143264 [Postia placenta MAD-698-R-SB12]EED77959.1 predicted protein [Postia placenta Mad-698-R]OSX62480.1 hypothetical protein POSPLADRAFT_1143264 [Postia placenta MAD-698-R-SB12]